MSRSSLCGFSEGAAGATHGNYPITREMDPVPDLRCRVIYSGGEWTPAATDADKARLAAKLVPVPTIEVKHARVMSIPRKLHARGKAAR
jgi:hypothetical protein